MVDIKAKTGANRKERENGFSIYSGKLKFRFFVRYYGVHKKVTGSSYKMHNFSIVCSGIGDMSDKIFRESPMLTMTEKEERL